MGLINSENMVTETIERGRYGVYGENDNTT